MHEEASRRIRHKDGCACRCSNNASDCEEAIASCRVERLGKLAVLKNPVYRVKDIIAHTGSRWRLDSATILCEPRYRGTFLRQVLEETSSNFSVFASDTQEDGHFYLTGYQGPSGMQLAPTGTTTRALARLLAVKCKHQPNDTQLIVVLRLGDQISNLPALQRQANTLLKQSPNINSVLISAVLHYGHNTLLTSAFDRSPEKDSASIQALHSILHFFRTEHNMTTHLRSDPVVDHDLCLYVYSPHIIGEKQEVPGSHFFSGFFGLVLVLKSLLFRSSAPSSSFHHNDGKDKEQHPPLTLPEWWK